MVKYVRFKHAYTQVHMCVLCIHIWKLTCVLCTHIAIARRTCTLFTHTKAHVRGDEDKHSTNGFLSLSLSVIVITYRFGRSSYAVLEMSLIGFKDYYCYSDSLGLSLAFVLLTVNSVIRFRRAENTLKEEKHPREIFYVVFVL